MPADLGREYLLGEIIKVFSPRYTDDFIRDILAKAPDFVVTESLRRKMLEGKAEKILRSVSKNMVKGLNDDGRLAIKDFAVFKTAESKGQLFPVAFDEPCAKADMFKVDVNILPGSVTYSGVVDSRVREGAYSLVGNHGMYASEYGWFSGDDALGLFVVEGGHHFVEDYGGLYRRDIRSCSGLLVRGHLIDAGPSRRDLVIDDAMPEIEGVFNSYSGSFYGSILPEVTWYEAGWHVVRDLVDFGFPHIFCSGRYLDKFLGRLAEGVLGAKQVHSLDVSGFPLPWTSFVNCFPRSKYMCGVDTWINGVPTRVYRPVEWWSRSAWNNKFGDDYDMWADLGREVPGLYMGERMPGVRCYAKFSDSVITRLNESIVG